MTSLSQDNYGPDYEDKFCPVEPEECRGRLRDSCMGCDFYDEDGEIIQEEE